MVLFGGGLSEPWIHFGQSFKAVLLLLLYICSITLSKKWPATLYMGQLTSSALSNMATLSLSLCCIVAPNVAFHLGTLGRSLSVTVLSCVLCLLNMFHTCTYLFQFLSSSMWKWRWRGEVLMAPGVSGDILIHHHACSNLLLFLVLFVSPHTRSVTWISVDFFFSVSLSSLAWILTQRGRNWKANVFSSCTCFFN